MDVTRLRDGAEVRIRPIRRDDGLRLQAAYGRLSPESRYQRFLGPKPRLTGSDARYLAEVDGSDHVALVATPVEHPEWIIGVGRFVRLRHDPGVAEVAVVVGDPWQRRGLGSELLARLAEAADERGIGRLRATMLAANAPAHRLARGANRGVVHSHRAGPIDELEVELAA